MNFEEYYRIREEQEKDLRDGEDTLKIKKHRAIKITEIVNEYHYNFISWRDYDIKKYKEWTFIILYLITALIFFSLIINLFASLFWKEKLFFSRIPTISMFILIITSCLCLIVVYISIKEDYKGAIVKRFSYLLDNIVSPEEDKNTVLSFLNINSRKNKNIRLIKEKWLEDIVLSENRLDFAKEVESWKSLYKKSIDTRELNILSIIVNKNSFVRILSLLIALFSLVAVLIAKTVEPSSVIENIGSNFTVLYKQLFILGFSLLVLGYEMYYIFPEIKSSLFDYMQDFSKDKEIYVESRFNRFISLLLINHNYKFNNDSNLKLPKNYDKNSI